jgi:nanoRNase/pAp phosphatase (c-di-AMP/oligoRNAs hydrolase)
MRNVTAEDRLRRLLELDLSKGPLLILTHDNPDPDSIASAAALRYLLQKLRGLESTVGYTGIIGRAENRAMVRLLGIHLASIPDEVDVDAFEHVALIDAQPHTGNSYPIPAERVVDIVIDHHPLRSTTAMTRLFDVRDSIGASATILTEYFRAAKLEVPTDLATALLYGIRSETQDLARETSEADREAYYFLVGRADVSKLANIARPVLERRYFRQMSDALDAVTVAGELCICPLGDVIDPDFVPEMADFLVRMESVRWVLVYGYFEGRLYLSMRTNETDANAGEVMQQLLDGLGKGGGHGMRAGGNIVTADVHLSRERMSQELDRRFLELMEVPGIAIVPLRESGNLA